MSATVRKLLSSDRDDIMEISRHIWDGHDYLPSVANEWLHDQDCHFYGSEVNGHVVAVGNLRLVENGQTGWMEGLRVHPKYRGKGLAKELTCYLVEKAESLGLQRLRYTTANRNTASLKLAKMAGFSRVFTLAVFWHLNPNTVPRAEGYPSIRKVSPTRTHNLLETNPDIVSHGILVYDWKALDGTLQNLEEIGKTSKFYAATKKGKVDSLSFGHPRREPDQAWWSTTMYAADLEGLMSQLAHNQATASKQGIKSIVCTFETRFEKPLREAVDWETGEHWGIRLVLLEKRMRS
jgi:N-acetylglutamate synthase-like GNAT family acetyltransferase